MNSGKLTLGKAVVDLPILRAACGPNALAAIADALNEAWSAASWVPTTIRSQVEIAVGEIAANIIEHAGRIQTATMEMQMQILGDHVEVAFTDTRIQAQIDLNGIHMPDELAERGRGLAIAKTVLAQLDYSRSELGNHWTLISQTFNAA